MRQEWICPSLPIRYGEELMPEKPRRHYERAPITEALIDIQVELPPSFELGQLERLHESIAAQYPGKRKGIEVHGEFTAGERVGAMTSQRPNGFHFSSADGR